MREIDAVLQSFLAVEALTLSLADLARFEEILEMPDPELHAYLSGRRAPVDPDIAALVERIRASHRPQA